jgi:hypothetical protein
MVWQTGRPTARHSLIIVKEGEITTLSIPDHKEVAKGSEKRRAAQKNDDSLNMAACIPI